MSTSGTPTPGSAALQPAAASPDTEQFYSVLQTRPFGFSPAFIDLMRDLSITNWTEFTEYVQPIGTASNFVSTYCYEWEAPPTDDSPFVTDLFLLYTFTPGQFYQPELD